MGTATVAHVVTVDVQHVGVFLGDQVGDVLQQPAAIDRIDHDVHLVAAPGLAPLHRQDALRAGGRQTGQRSAVCTMHGDTAATGQVADDGFAGHRLAAARQLYQQVAHALYGELGLAQVLAARGRPRQARRGRRLACCTFGFQQGTADLVRPGIAQRHLDVEVVNAVGMELLRRDGQVRVLQPQALQLALEQFAPGLHVAGAVQLVEPAAHLLARTVAGQEAVGRHQPVAARVGLLAGQYLDPVATAQTVSQRYDAAIDLRATAAVANHGVHLIGEIERRGALRQVQHLVLRAQRIDPVLGQFGIERPGQFVALPVLGLLQQLAHPGDLAVEGLLRALAAFLVLPVRGHAQLGLRMHLVGTDLHFNGAPFRTNHGGMQRAIVVGLGPGDVIVELARHRCPQCMHHAQRGIAGGDIVDHYPHRTDVVQLVERQPLLLHLPPDAVDVLRAATDLGLDALRNQLARQHLLDILDVALAGDAGFVDFPSNAPVGLRLQVAERQVLQLPLQLPDAQAVGQWRVDVACQLRQRAALLVVQLVGRAHPRQLPGQQDRHHAQVADDRQQQPAQALAVASGLTAGVQCPHRVGRILAVEQADHRRLVVAQRQLVQAGTQARQVKQQCCHHRAFVGREHRQRIEGIAQHRPGSTHLVVAIRRFPMLAQGLAQRSRQHRCRGTVQQGIQAGDGSAVHSIKQARQRPLH